MILYIEALSLVREGVVYGLGLAMTSLCKATATAVITMHIKSTYNKMVKFYERERSKESSKLQVLSYWVHRKLI